MRTFTIPLVLLSACWGDDAYIVEGTVYEKPSPTRIVVAHEEIAGLMPEMVMPFDVEDPALLADVEPGDRILARLHVEQQGSFLRKVRVVGQGVVPADYDPVGTSAVLPGATFPDTTVRVATGEVLQLHGEPTVLTFAYTTCPLPDFCPATMSKMQALQEQLAGDGRIVVVTIDPETDTDDVLTAFAETLGANPAEWHFGRVDDLPAIAEAAGLSVEPDGGAILHGRRTVVLAADGTLIERYDDNRYDVARVVSQIRTGEPKAPPGSEGTLTPE